MSGKIVLICLVVVVAMVMNEAEAGGCQPPTIGCRCTFPGYPCKHGFSYGCKYGHCWAQCTAVLAGCKEWCYAKSESSGNYYTCSRNKDCSDAADCSKSKCSGGCTVARGYERYRDLMIMKQNIEFEPEF